LVKDNRFLAEVLRSVDVGVRISLALVKDNRFFAEVLTIGDVGCLRKSSSVVECDAFRTTFALRTVGVFLTKSNGKVISTCFHF
jgi:hypothetical protein